MNIVTDLKSECNTRPLLLRKNNETYGKKDGQQEKLVGGICGA